MTVHPGGSQFRYFDSFTVGIAFGSALRLLRSSISDSHITVSELSCLYSEGTKVLSRENEATASVGTEVAETVLGMCTPVPPTDAPALAGAAHREGEGFGSRRVGERQVVLWSGRAGLG